MRFAVPLISGRLERRYNRFFADVTLAGNQVVVAHVPNTGSLKGCVEPGQPCLVSPATQPERKLRYTLEMIKGQSSWIGVNTGHPNKLIKELFAEKALAHWKPYSDVQFEVKVDSETRMDAVLFNPWPDKKAGSRIVAGDFKKYKFHFLEFKNVTMAEGTAALFPDAVTERGQKHLKTLMALNAKGHTSEIVFVIQREDVNTFRPAAAIDPEYANLLVKAQKAGVKVTALACRLNESEIRIDPSIQVTLELD